MVNIAIILFTEPNLTFIVNYKIIYYEFVVEILQIRLEALKNKIKLSYIR